MEDDSDSKDFCEEDIDHILQRRTQVVQIEAGVKGSTFAKASFSLSTNRNDIDIDDPEFWQKWAKKADVDLEIMQHKVLFINIQLFCFGVQVLCELFETNVFQNFEPLVF